MVREDELDLRPYFVAALRHWKIVAVVTMLGAAIGAASGLATQPGLEATANVAIAASGSQPVPSAKAYIDIALGDKVLAGLAQDLAASGGPAPEVGDLRTRLTISQGADSSLVALKARGADQAGATSLVNAWSAAFVRVSRSSINLLQDENLKLLESQLQAAQNQLRDAENALSAQEKKEGLSSLQAEMTARQNRLAQLHASKAALSAAADQANAVRNRLKQLDPRAPSSSRDDLDLLQLQMALFGNWGQVQLSQPLSPSGRSIGEQLSSLEGLASTIAERSQDLDRQIAADQALMGDLNDRMQQVTDGQVAALANRDVARQTVKDLSSKEAQARIAVTTNASLPRITADTSIQPLARGTSRNVAIGAALGLLIAFVISVGMDRMAKRGSGAPLSPESSPSS